MRRGILVAKDPCFLGPCGTSIIGNIQVDPGWTVVHVPCMRGVRFFHLICELPEFSVFREEAYA